MRDGHDLLARTASSDELNIVSTAVPLALIASPVALILYAYLGYPALLG
jgi:hypothetical protein